MATTFKIDFQIFDCGFQTWGKSIMITEIYGKSIDTREIIELLITDSIFCLHEFLKAAEIFGVSYNINHAFIAKAHLELAEWCKYYYSYLKNSEEKHQESIISTLSNLIGEADIKTVAPAYHYEMALSHSYSSLETHNEGKAYREIIEDMFYLNDDLNDNFYHFFAAIERYRINTGSVNDIIKKAKENLTKGSLYNYDNYVG